MRLSSNGREGVTGGAHAAAALRNRAPKRCMPHDVGSLKTDIFDSASVAVGRKTRRARPGSTPGSVRVQDRSCRLPVVPKVKNEKSSPHPLTVRNFSDKNKKVGLVYQMRIVMGMAKLRENEEKKRAVAAFELVVIASLRRSWPSTTPRPPRFLRRPVRRSGRPWIAVARIGREEELLAT